MKKPRARFSPPGKAVWEKKVPPRERRILKNGWLVRKNSRNRGNRLRWLAKADREGDSLMGANADKTKFSIRVDRKLLELADACIADGTARSRTGQKRSICT